MFNVLSSSLLSKVLLLLLVKNGIHSFSLTSTPTIFSKKNPVRCCSIRHLKKSSNVSKRNIHDNILNDKTNFLENTRLCMNDSNKNEDGYELKRSEQENTSLLPNMSPSEIERESEDTESGGNARGSTNEYSFFDEAYIYVRAGSGGQGASTYKKGVKGQNSHPDGGSGGRGGNVLIIADASLNTLAGLVNTNSNRFLQSFRAENGQDGDRQFKNGKYGNDVVIRVPPGTVVEEEIIENEGEENELRELNELGTVVLPSTEEDDFDWKWKNTVELVVARGGDGGEGTSASQSKGGRGVRRPRAPPVGGERKRLKLTLKIVADVALVGVPNAGKSTFLASVTRAKPKIANYPFTTVIPNLGVWIPSKNNDNYDPNEYYKDHKNKSRISMDPSGSAGLVLCDVPGLIAGAADGIGLGHAFLRHVERCHAILHLVDATSDDPINDFNMVNREIVRYGNGKLAQMPQVVVVNKIDTWEEDELLEGEYFDKKTRLTKEILEKKMLESMPHTRLMWMSAKEKDGVDELMNRMSTFVKKVKDSKTN